MTTFPSFPDEHERRANRQGLCSERYGFHVAGKDFTIQFWRMASLEGYDDRQCAALKAAVAFEVSFRLEDYTQSDGTVLCGYETLGTGNPFQILGGVANGIVAWAKERQPDYLYWRAHSTGRQRLYDKMIRCFAARGSGWQRLAADPFTGLRCEPDTFWLGNTSYQPVVESALPPFIPFPGLDPMTELPAHRRPPSRAGRTDEDALLLRAMWQRNSEIETIGIVSARNEAGRQLSEPENDRRDEGLRCDLADYESWQTRGRFGDVGKPLLSMVNPFTVVNMAREAVVALGAKYHQFHVIFGAREGEDQDLAWRFELVEADRAARVLAARKILFDAHRQRLYLGAACPGNCGRHFVIPGVDDTDPDLNFLDGR